MGNEERVADRGLRKRMGRWKKGKKRCKCFEWVERKAEIVVKGKKKEAWAMREGVADRGLRKRL